MSNDNNNTTFTAAQSRIIDAIAEGENGSTTIDNAAGVLSSCKALAAKGVIEYEQTDDGIVVTLVPEKKGNRKIWDVALASNVNGDDCAVNEEGQLTEVPVNFPKGHYPLMKGQFAETALWFEWKAVLCTQRSDEQLAAAESFRVKAQEAREGVSAETMLAKIRARRAKAEAKFAAEEAALLAEMGDDSETEEG